VFLCMRKETRAYFRRALATPREPLNNIHPTEARGSPTSDYSRSSYSGDRINQLSIRVHARAHALRGRRERASFFRARLRERAREKSEKRDALGVCQQDGESGERDTRDKNDKRGNPV